jgi:endonuclease/exonuclease/phosphatase family metal-dependent hydrolase
MRNLEKVIGRRAVLLAALALSIGLFGGCSRGSTWETPVTVMTRNVYYGFDVGPLLSATDPNDIPVLAAQAFAQLNATNFPERAAAMADEIALKRPQLIALQEVALIRIQSPGDAVVGGTVPADTVYLDYLQILLDALAARGLDYQVAGQVQNADVELPMLVGTSPLAFDDVRLTDRDVVLARGDVAISGVTSANYVAKLTLPTLGVDVLRGYVAVNAAIAGIEYRFVATHLEDTPFPVVQMAQAQELVAVLAAETRTVILAGDFNSDAPAGATVQYLASQGFGDAWTRNQQPDAGSGLTWGHDADLTDPADTFSQRIDLVLTRDGVLRAGAATVNVLDGKTPSGLWTSDHAGVFARLWFAIPE